MQPQVNLCTRCGSPNDIIDVRFCHACGSPMHKTSNRWAIILILFAAVSFVGLVALFVIVNTINAKKRPNQTDVKAVWASPTPTLMASSRTNEYSSTSSVEATSGAGVTMSNYNRIQTGMTYARVCQILGKGGTELSRNKIAGYETVMYQWEGDGLANMNAIFQNDKLVQKAQFGLK
jgi:hypothetical protein